MFTSIFINNFRCFEELSIESLDRVNLIAGKNNVGKTALLEAIFLLTGGANITLVFTLAALRGIHNFNQPAMGELLFEPLFSKLDRKTIVRLRGLLSTGEQPSMELQMVPGVSTQVALGNETTGRIELGTNEPPGQVLQLQYTGLSGQSYISQMRPEGQGLRVEPQPIGPLFPAYFLGSYTGGAYQQEAEQLGRLEVVKEPYNLLESLRILEPRLRRVAVIVVAGIPIIYGDIGLNRMLPLSLMGEGLRRLNSILLAIANAPGGIVLIDEIENGIHHSAISKVWQAIGDAARRFNTQIVATTHSYECIEAAYQAFAQMESHDFRLHRLDAIAERVRVVTYDWETLAAALKAELEVR